MNKVIDRYFENKNKKKAAKVGSPVEYSFSVPATLCSGGIRIEKDSSDIVSIHVSLHDEWDSAFMNISPKEAAQRILSVVEKALADEVGKIIA